MRGSSGTVAPPPESATAQVVVTGFQSAPSGLVRVNMVLANGQHVGVIIDKRNVSVGGVELAAAAIAQVALIGKGLL